MSGDMFKGLGVALVTPFNSDGSVDFASLTKLVKHQLDAKTDVLVVMGTTGESVTLNKEEKFEILDAIIKQNNGQAKIVWGCGGNDTNKVAEELAAFDVAGVDGILSVSPAYNKPTQEGIYQHYAVLAKATKLPIILYNVPGRTGSNMTAATTLRLANDFDNIVATKEASGDLEQLANIIEHKPDGFEVLSGDDALTLPILSLGGIGVISVVGNAYPEIFRNMVFHQLNGEGKQAQKEFYKVNELIANLFKEGNPGGIKETLKYLDICSNDMRMPLIPVGDELSAKIKQLVSKIG